MIITVECIHRARDSTGPITDGTVLDTDNMVSDCNKVTCRINSILSETQFRLLEGSIILNDIMNFSNDMDIYRQYDCVLEIVSFNRVELFTNHRCSIRGKYWRNVPQKYSPKYQMYKNRECIEIGNDILLISMCNNLLTDKIADGEIIEILTNCELNLICAKI